VFCTVLNNLKSPENVGSLVRSHRSFGGKEFVFLGHNLPWNFKKRSQAFSRKLERQVEIVHLSEEDLFFDWAKKNKYTPIAVEIAPNAIPVHKFEFPERCALVLGRESTGLSKDFLERCAVVVVVSQSGPVGSLNVGVAGSIAMYVHSLQRGKFQEISGSKFAGEVES